MEYSDYEQYKIQKYAKKLILKEKKQLNKKNLTWKETERLFNIAVQLMEEDKKPKCISCDDTLENPNTSFCSEKCEVVNRRILKEEEKQAKAYRKWAEGKTREQITEMTEEQYARWNTLCNFDLWVCEVLQEKYGKY
jgi:hypothetical protein